MASYQSLSLTQFFVLTALLRCPLHAYALRQEIIELSQHQVWPAYSTIQHSLSRLASHGYIEPRADNPYYWLKARRGVVYQLTPAGRNRVIRLLNMHIHVLKTARFWMQQRFAIETYDQQQRRFIDTSLSGFGSLSDDYTESG